MKKKMAVVLLAAASLMLATACGAKKNSDTTAAESASSAAESQATSEGASTVANESTDPGDENVVYDTYSPEELSSIQQSEEEENAKEDAEENAKDEAEETKAQGSEQADDGPTGKVTKIKKNKAGNYVKPESTSKAVEPPLSATISEESESAH